MNEIVKNRIIDAFIVVGNGKNRNLEKEFEKEAR